MLGAGRTGGREAAGGAALATATSVDAPGTADVGRSKPAPGASPIDDSEGLAAKRYDARPGTCYLLRPDQHVCARWRAFELGAVRAAVARATAHVATAAKAAA